MTNLSSMDQNVAGIRDRILLACLSNDEVSARSVMKELIALLDRGDFPQDVEKEVKCRILESQLDIDAISENPIESLVETLKEICRSSDFSEERRTEVISRGLSKISVVASK